MQIDACLEKITDLSIWDLQFYILAEGSGGHRWPVSFCGNAAKMLDAWKTGDTQKMRIPDNGDFIHGLLFVSEADGSAMVVAEHDLDGRDFKWLMRCLKKKA